ncbi:MAG: TFIIB-type zinc ribbon-containing protein [Candidatus Nealsonbacteria bacterium]
MIDFTETCPECGNKNLILQEKEAQTVCPRCGLVVSYKEIDLKGGIKQKGHGPEYPVRTITHYGNLGSYIDRKNLDSSGNEIPSITRSTMGRLRKYSGFKDNEERRLQAAIIELNQVLRQISPEFRITNVFKKELKLFFTKVLKKVDARGKSFRVFGAAAFCFLYKKEGNPNPIKEISKLTQIRLKSIFREYANLIKIFEQKKQSQNLAKYISTVSETTGISIKTQKLTLKIFTEIKEDFSGKSVKGLIAGLLYLLCKNNGEKKTQKEIAKANGVTEVTLRTRAKELEKFNLLYTY